MSGGDGKGIPALVRSTWTFALLIEFLKELHNMNVPRAPLLAEVHGDWCVVMKTDDGWDASRTWPYAAAWPQHALGLYWMSTLYDIRQECNVTIMPFEI